MQCIHVRLRYDQVVEVQSKRMVVVNRSARRSRPKYGAP